MRALPAAAIKEGTAVRLPGFIEDDESATISKVHNSTPRSGRITWETDKGEVEVGGNQAVEVVRLP